MLIHATITISGDKAALGACEARLRRLLSGQFLKNEVTEHHGPQALCYDLKVEGGIPFPLFAQASQEFPALEFAAEWVNIAAGEKGSSTIVNGRVTRQANELVTTRAGDEHAIHIEVAADEWRGYAVTANRDALLRAVRAPGADEVTLYATEGGPEWACAWRGSLAARRYARETLERPRAIDKAQFEELDNLARNFAKGWVWFASEGREDIAIERERYARVGLTSSDANLRWARLHRMRADAVEGQALAHSTLAPEDLWVKDLVLATWVSER